MLVRAAMMGRMGRLIARVRDAEERLAGVARALQSAYDEELAEALQARDAARESRARAEAMEAAARSLGRDELARRSAELVAQLDESLADAERRIEELGRVEVSLRERLTPAPRATPLPVLEPASIPPPTPAPSPTIDEAEVEAEVEGEEEEADAPVEEPAPPPPPPAPVEPPKAEAPKPDAMTVLEARVAELEKVGARLPIAVLTPALQELVALCRLQTQRQPMAAEQPTALLARVAALGRARSVEGLFGVDPKEFADWPKLAAEARTQRQTALAAAKAKKPNA